MDKINDGGGPIFPSNYITISTGMSLRQYYAGCALTGMMSTWRETPANYTVDMLSKEVFSIADAMLKAEELK